MLQRRDTGKEVPRAFIVIGRQHAAAAQRIRAVGKSGTVQAAAEQRECLVDRDVASLNSAVADQERGSSQRSDSAADKISFHVRPDLLKTANRASNPLQ